MFFNMYVHEHQFMVVWYCKYTTHVHVGRPGSTINSDSSIHASIHTYMHISLTLAYWKSCSCKSIEISMHVMIGGGGGGDINSQALIG